MTYGLGSSAVCGSGAHTRGINELPNELLLHILSQLDWESALAAASVCLRWRWLALTPFLWENMRLVVCMKNYTSLSQSIVPHVSKYFKHVKLQYFKLYSHVREPLMLYCPNLTHLEMSISQIDSCIFQDLRSWPNLKYLSFRNSLITQDPDSENRNHRYELPFDALPMLETIILSNFALSSIEGMLSCHYLVSINMEKMKNIPSEFLKSLVDAKVNLLEALHVYGDTLDEEVIESISRCRRLRTLHIMTCKTLFDSSLLHLAQLSTLRSLKLRHGYFSAPALLWCFGNGPFPQLTYLSLSRCQHVTVEVAQAIKVGAPLLRELSFYLCPFIVEPNFDRAELEVFISPSSTVPPRDDKYQYLTNRDIATRRYKREDGYNYDRPKLSFELPSRPVAPTQTASQGSGSGRAGYAYTAGSAVSIGGGGAGTTAGAGNAATAGSAVSIGSGGAGTTAGAGTTGAGTTAGAGNAATAGTAAVGSGSTGYGYSSPSPTGTSAGGGAGTTAGARSTAGYSGTTSGRSGGYDYDSGAVARASAGTPAARGASTNAPTYLPPSLSPAVSGNGDNGVVSGEPAPAALEASYLPPGAATSVSVGPTGSSGPTAPPPVTDQYLPPQTAGPSSPGYPTLSPSFVPSAPAQDYLPPGNATPPPPQPGAISTPAPTYLPPFL